MSIRRTLLVTSVNRIIGLRTVIITFTAYFNAAHEMHELFSDGMKRMAIVIKDQVFAKVSSKIIHKSIPKISTLMNPKKVPSFKFGMLRVNGNIPTPQEVELAFATARWIQHLHLFMGKSGKF